MRTSLIAPALIASLAVTSPAGACSWARGHPTDSEIEQFVLGRYRAASALVEIEVLTGSTFERPGTARVVRVHQGDVDVGRLYRMRGDTDSCGPGNIVAGTRGWMLVGRSEPEVFPGFVSETGIAILRRHGLADLPAR